MSHTTAHRIQQIFERENLRRMLQEIYLAKLLRFVPPIIVPPHPGPDPAPFLGEPQPQPQPQPSIASELANQNLLIGELLSHALGDPTPQPNISSIVNEIRKDNLHIEVIEELIQKIESGVKSLKSELEVLKKCK